MKEIFESAGNRTWGHESLGGRLDNTQLNCIKKGIINIDMHTQFTWQKKEYLDQELLWSNPRTQKEEGVEILLPPLEVEFLVNAAEVLFERFYLNMLIFLFMKEACLEGMDWHLILGQVEKYGWEKAFSGLMRRVEFFSRKFYGSQTADRLFPEEVREYFLQKAGGVKLPGKVVLPCFFPRRDVMKLFYERALHGELDKTCFAYYWYITGRYFLTRRKRFPYYQDWYPFDRYCWKDTERFK